MFSRRNDLPESRDSTNDSQPTNCFPHSTMRPLPPPPPAITLFSTSFHRKALCGFAVRSRLSLPCLPPFFYFPPSTINHRLLFSFHPPLVIVLSFESSVCRVSLAAFRMDRDRYSIERLLFVSFRKRKRAEWVEGGGKEGRKKKKRDKVVVNGVSRSNKETYLEGPRGVSVVGKVAVSTEHNGISGVVARRTRCGELFGRVTFRKSSFIGIKRIPPSFPPIPPR